MILFLITLAFLAFWSPRWSTLALFTVLVTAAASAVLAWTAGLLNPEVDYRSAEAVALYGAIARSVGVNTALYVAIGSLIVLWGKHRRQQDARELEMLARLTQAPPEKQD